MELAIALWIVFIVFAICMFAVMRPTYKRIQETSDITVDPFLESQREMMERHGYRNYLYFALALIIPFFFVDNDTGYLTFTLFVGIFFWVWLGMLAHNKFAPKPEETTGWYQLQFVRKAIGHSIYVLFVLAMIVGSQSDIINDDISGDVQQTSELEWYEGGTLTNKETMAEWHDATDRDRLASAAQWAWVSMGKPEPYHPEVLRIVATSIVACLNEIGRETQVRLQESAALCYILLEPDLKKTGVIN
jgi:hypothetical protein